MTAIIIIGAIIQLALLIVFFVMASNVSKIKKHLLKTDATGERYFNKAQEEIQIGHKEKAKEYLLRAKYYYEVKHEGATGSYRSDGAWIWDPNKKVTEIDEQLSKL